MCSEKRRKPQREVLEKLKKWEWGKKKEIKLIMFFLEVAKWKIKVKKFWIFMMIILMILIILIFYLWFLVIENNWIFNFHWIIKKKNSLIF